MISDSTNAANYKKTLVGAMSS